MFVDEDTEEVSSYSSNTFVIRILVCQFNVGDLPEMSLGLFTPSPTYIKGRLTLTRRKDTTRVEKRDTVMIDHGQV